jgi:hypothetical protein
MNLKLNKKLNKNKKPKIKGPSEVALRGIKSGASNGSSQILRPEMETICIVPKVRPLV